jgi:MipA family protein
MTLLMTRGINLFCLFAFCGAVANADTPPSASPVASDPGSVLTDRALWEAGIVGAVSYLPDYPAADQNRAKWIAAPYLVYRGKIMRADRDGARASFLRRKYYEVDLGIAASFATRSKDNRAREGMPDLDYLLELGPRLSVSLSDLGGNGKLRLFLPLRAVFSTDLGDFHHRGYTLTPSLNGRLRLGKRTDRFAIAQLTANFGNRQMNAYFYDVAPRFVRPDRDFYDARGGYMGSDLFAGVLLPLAKRLRLFSGAQILVHSGSANQTSPLFRRPVNYSLVAGMVWTFYRSPKPAVVID